MSAAPPIRTSRASRPASQNGFLYGWLLLAIVFEYARPAAFVPALRAVPLNSLIPLALLLVCMAASGLRPAREIFADSMTRWLCVYLALVWASVLHGDNTLRAFNTFKMCLGYAFLAFMIARIVTTRARLIGVFVTLIAAHVFLLIMNPAVILNPEVRNYVRGATFLGDGNDFALSVAILIPLAAVTALTRPSKMMRLMFFGVALFLVLALVATSSRGATLALGGVIFFLVAYSKKKMAAFAGVAVVAVAVLAYAPSTYFQRVGTVATYQEDTSATGRIEAWKAGARMAMANPVLGVGAGNFPNNFPKYRGPNAPVRWMTAHSMYFLILGEMGLPGIAILLTLVFGNIVRNLRVLAPLQDPAIASSANVDADRLLLLYLAAAFVGLSIAGAFLSVAYYPHIFVLTALAVAARQMAQESLQAAQPAGAADNAPAAVSSKRRRVGAGPRVRGARQTTP